MMPIPFEKLAELVNRTQPKAVRKWCEKNGVLWMPDADGRPTTSESAYNEALRRGRGTRPNF